MVWTDFKFSLIKHAQDLWWLFDYGLLAYEHLRTLGTRWQLNIVLLVVCKCKIKKFNIWIKKYIYRADAGIVQNDEIINSYILHKGFIKMQYLWLILQQPGLTATILEAENIVGESWRWWGQNMNRMFKNTLWAVKKTTYTMHTCICMYSSPTASYGMSAAL